MSSWHTVSKPDQYSYMFGEKKKRKDKGTQEKRDSKVQAKPVRLVLITKQDLLFS